MQQIFPSMYRQDLQKYLLRTSLLTPTPNHTTLIAAMGLELSMKSDCSSQLAIESESALIDLPLGLRSDVCKSIFWDVKEG